MDKPITDTSECARKALAVKQIALGMHAAAGIALANWSIRVGLGTIQTFLFEGTAGIAIALLGMAWIAVWFVIARRRHKPPRHEQPQATFTFAPAVVSLVVHLSTSAYFLTSFTLFDPIWNPVLFGMVIILVALPLGMLSWAVAGIRFHVGTWALAWSISILGVWVAAGVIANHAADV